MGLEKAIKYKKEHRKPYRGSKRFDTSCRNHGSCEYCKGNRLYSNNKRNRESLDKSNDYIND